MVEPPEHPLSLQEARALIVDELFLGRLRAWPDAELYVRSEPLPPGATVAPAVEVDHAVHRDAEPWSVTVEEPTWFAWLDLQPGHRFVHATQFLFIDSEGDIEVMDGLSWPRIDGEPYLADGSERASTEDRVAIPGEWTVPLQVPADPLPPGAALTGGRLVALLVSGVDEEEGPTSGTARDLELVSDLLVGLGTDVQDISTLWAPDGDALRAGVAAGCADLGDDDSFLLAYTGHGVGGAALVVRSGAPPAELPWADVAEALADSCAAGHLDVLVQASFSGTAHAPFDAEFGDQPAPEVRLWTSTPAAEPVPDGPWFAQVLGDATADALAESPPTTVAELEAALGPVDFDGRYAQAKEALLGRLLIEAGSRGIVDRSESLEAGTPVVDTPEAIERFEQQLRAQLAPLAPTLAAFGPFEPVACCEGLPRFTVDAVANSACGAGVAHEAPVPVGELAPGTWRVYYEAGATQSSVFEWNRKFTECCSPLCPVSTTNQCWLAEWTFGELPGFATWGPDTVQEAEDAHRCQFRDVTVTETTAAEAWYLDNDETDNVGSVTYCFEQLF